MAIGDHDAPAEHAADSKDIAERLAALEARIADLEAENEQLRDQVEAQTATIEDLQLRLEKRYEKKISWLQELLTGDPDGHLSEAQDDLLEEGSVLAHLHTAATTDALETEQQQRSQADAKLKRRIGVLADELGVELSDAAIQGEDKITRVLKYGPDDVVDHTYPVHYRARDVLAHAGAWGEPVEDTLGRRITLHRPVVRQRLEEYRNEQLQSKQVGDVFEKIVEWAAESPRRAFTEKGDDGTVHLVIYVDQEAARE